MSNKQWSMALVLAALAGAATAQGAAPAMRCGGVGDDDQQRIKAEARQKGLLVTFAAAGGAYLADVDVEIRRGSEVVVQGRCDGPLMLVDLPPGSYAITATAQGRTQKQAVKVGARPSSIVMRWPGG